MMVGEEKHEELEIAGSTVSSIKKQSDEGCLYSEWDSRCFLYLVRVLSLEIAT